MFWACAKITEKSQKFTHTLHTQKLGIKIWFSCKFLIISSQTIKTLIRNDEGEFSSFIEILNYSSLFESTNITQNTHDHQSAWIACVFLLCKQTWILFLIFNANIFATITSGLRQGLQLITAQRSKIKCIQITRFGQRSPITSNV